MTSNHPEPTPRVDLEKERRRIIRRDAMKMALILLCTVLMVKKTNAEATTESLNVTTQEIVAIEFKAPESRKIERSTEDGIFVQQRGKKTNQINDKIYRPYFDDKIEVNITSQLTKTAHLHCSIHELGDKTVSWVRQSDLHILTVGKYTYTTDGRFTSIHMDDSDTWTLEIHDTRKEDEGTYECQVSTEPKMSLAIRLNIIVVEAHISEGPFLYMKSGTPINLTCHVKDQVGTVYIFWYLDGRVLDEGEKKAEA